MIVVATVATVAATALVLRLALRPRQKPTRRGYEPTEAETRVLEEKRRAAIEAAADRWLLHPANAVTKKEARNGRR